MTTKRAFLLPAQAGRKKKRRWTESENRNVA